MKHFLKTAFMIVVIAFLSLFSFFWYISGSPAGLFKIIMVYATVDTVFMRDVSHAQLFEGALKGIVKSLGEKHSSYLSKKDMERLLQSMDGTYSGVGIYMSSKEGLPIVVSVIEDLPASEAGVLAGDIIVSIDGAPTETMTLDQVSDLVRGQEGSVVVLGIRRGLEELTISIERKKIVLPTVKARMLEDEVAYIRITQFGDHAGEEFKTAYADLQSQGMKRLIVDMRGNPGGLLTAAKDIGDYLIPKGTIVSIKTKYGADEVYESEGVVPTIPLVVLIDGGSASASEIVAGAVQDRKAGIIIGDKSYGKGTVQSIINNFDGEAIKLTIAQYRTPNERIIDGEGITPDIVYPMDMAIPYGSPWDIQLSKALSVVKEMPIP